jgi:hypothetical protein
MLKISEVLPNPEGADKGGEYILVRNTGESSIGVSGWSIKNGAGKKIPLSGTIEPGESAKVLTGSVSLKNQGDSLSLIDSAGKTQDVFDYSVAASGQILQPAGFLTEQTRQQLFEELVVDSSGADSVSAKSGHVSAGGIFYAVVVGLIFAAVAVFVLNRVKYDDLVKSPLEKSK